MSRIWPVLLLLWCLPGLSQEPAPENQAPQVNRLAPRLMVVDLTLRRASQQAPFYSLLWPIAPSFS